MRLLVFGHASHTGFGVVTEALGKRFLAAGVDLRVLAVNHRGNPIGGDYGSRVYPAAMFSDQFAGDISHAAIDGSLWRKFGDDWAADVVLVVGDVSSLTANIGRRGLTGPWTKVPVFHYCPIEGDNLTPAWKDIWAQIQPVAMSDYGAQQIGKLIGRVVPRVYHGVDAEVFFPASQTNPLQYKDSLLRSKDDAKRAFKFDPARKMILRTDRLVERKFYDRFITAMLPVLEADPAVDVVIHCSPVDDNLNLYYELDRVPVEMRGRILLTRAHDTYQGLPVEGMAALFNAADLYVSTTGGEGFGLNLAESLACGTPVVVTDWAADAEVVGPGGSVIAPLTDTYGEPVRYHSSYGMDWAVPDPKAFSVEVSRLLSKPATRKAMGQAGRLHVERNFSWDTAANEFMSLFEDANAGSARLAS